jgi:hypothetical protein
MARKRSNKKTLTGLEKWRYESEISNLFYRWVKRFAPSEGRLAVLNGKSIWMRHVVCWILELKYHGATHKSVGIYPGGYGSTQNSVGIFLGATQKSVDIYRGATQKSADIHHGATHKSVDMNGAIPLWTWMHMDIKWSTTKWEEGGSIAINHTLWHSKFDKQV